MSVVTREDVERAFSTKYENMIGYAFSLCSNDDIAEDLVSDVFSNIWIRPPVLEEGKTLSDYMAVAIRNRYLDDYVKSHYHSRTIRLGHLELDQIDDFL